MIIIKIIILYFIQIRHTDDFPSTGTRLVLYNDAYEMYVCLLIILSGDTWFPSPSINNLTIVDENMAYFGNF